MDKRKAKPTLNPAQQEVRRTSFNPSQDLGFGQRQHKGVCKSCHHVMLEVDGTFYRCEYVRQGRTQFKFGDPEVLPFLRKRDRRSNKRAEKF